MTVAQTKALAACSSQATSSLLAVRQWMSLEQQSMLMARESAPVDWVSKPQRVEPTAMHKP